MSGMKKFVSFALMAVMLTAMSTTALAAPITNTISPEVTVTATPLAPIVGSVQTITLNTDLNNVTTVDVTLLDANNVTQMVTLSLDEAVALGVVTLDVNNVPSVNNVMIGQTVTILPPEPIEESVQNPVGMLIASFFGLDPAVVDSFHKEGSGYGVIAQACWISYELRGDASQCSDILEAKKSGDYSAFVLSDGTTPANWGQFMKTASENKGHMHNLGAIVSGHADPLATLTPTVSPSPLADNKDLNGNGNNKAHGKGNNNGKGSHK